MTSMRGGGRRGWIRFSTRRETVGEEEDGWDDEDIDESRDGKVSVDSNRKRHEKR